MPIDENIRILLNQKYVYILWLTSRHSTAYSAILWQVPRHSSAE